MNKPKITFIVIGILAVAVLFLGVGYFSVVQELRVTEAALHIQITNQKIIDFERLFISEVLKADKEVSFDTRLKLETAVRNLDDEDVLRQWQKFVDSKTESGAQEEVKNLLSILVDKVRAK